jgi:hypothetical protein
MMHGPTKALQVSIQQKQTDSLALLVDAFNLSTEPFLSMSENDKSGDETGIK